jgi:hypothetical protein
MAQIKVGVKTQSETAAAASLEETDPKLAIRVASGAIGIRSDRYLIP